MRDSAVAEERRTAAVLLGHALKADRAYLLTRSHEQIDDALYGDYLRLIKRRAAGEPLQYVTGHQEFYEIDFQVTPDVLVPRPETEFLVEQVIKLSEDNGVRAALQIDNQSRPLIVDVGTGSGCIAVTLAAHINNARVIAIDVSRAAIEVARKNAVRNGAAERIEFLEGDLLEPLAGRELEGAIDFIASNPPYVDEARPELVQPEVSEWEPRIALFGGGGGLDFYRRLICDAPKYLKPSGFMILEIGYGQLKAIKDLIDESQFELVDVTNDLQGIPRTLTLNRKSTD